MTPRPRPIPPECSAALEWNPESTFLRNGTGLVPDCSPAGGTRTSTLNWRETDSGWHGWHGPPVPQPGREVEFATAHSVAAQPVFSVVMCFRNAASVLKQAINSVFAQTISNWELILIDDASTDDSASVYEPYLADRRVRLVRQESQKGLGSNKTLGIQRSRGEYVAIVDGDDAIVPEALQKVLAAYREDRRRGMVYSTYRDMDSGQQTCWICPYPSDGSMGSGTDVVSHLLTFRRREFGLADVITDLPYTWDKRAIAALEEVTYPYFLPEPLYLYRRSTANDRVAQMSLAIFDRVKRWATEREAGVSVIIPYHGRWELLDQTLESLRVARNHTTVPNEILVSCWNDDPLTPPWVRKVHLNEGARFSRGRMLNYGARQANFRKLFFLDADVKVPPCFIDEVCSRVAYQQAWLPICRDLIIPRQGCDQSGWRIYGYGLLGIMKRDFWWTGGWDEWEFWGGEDDVMRGKLELNSCRLIRDRLRSLVHQHHPFAGCDDNASRMERQRRIEDALAIFKNLFTPVSEDDSLSGH